MKIEKLITAFITSCLLFGLVNVAKATVMSVDTGYEVRYGINMNPGTSNGSDVQSTFIFEWDDINFNVDYAGTFAGQGNTYISHIIDFEPTSALLIGYGEGIDGIGDGKDHLYTITSSAFASTVDAGLKWSAIFPSLTPETRIGHSAMISMLNDANLAALTDFVQTEGYVAAFNPASEFVVLEWSGCGPGTEPGPGGGCVPVGGSIPEPSTLALLSLGLTGLGFARRKMKT